MESRARMPITSKFSEEFYETLGHGIADELVDWFNRVDDTYRTDLFRLNDLNFSRFEAKVDQRFAEQDAKWAKLFVELGARMDQRFVEQDAKWAKLFVEFEAKMDKRFVEFETRMDKRFGELEAKMDKRFVELEAKMDTRFAEQDAKWEARLGEMRAGLMRWMFGLWATSMVTMIGLVVALVRALA